MFKFKKQKIDFQENYLNLESEFLKLKEENEKLKNEINENNEILKSFIVLIKFIKGITKNEIKQ